MSTCKYDVQRVRKQYCKERKSMVILTVNLPPRNGNNDVEEKKVTGKATEASRRSIYISIDKTSAPDRKTFSITLALLLCDLNSIFYAISSAINIKSRTLNSSV